MKSVSIRQTVKEQTNSLKKRPSWKLVFS